MAKLIIQINNLSADIEADDALIEEYVTNYLEAYGMNENMPQQKKLKRFIKHLANHIKSVADVAIVNKEIEEQREIISERRKSKKWKDNDD